MNKKLLLSPECQTLLYKSPPVAHRIPGGLRDRAVNIRCYLVIYALPRAAWRVGTLTNYPRLSTDIYHEFCRVNRNYPLLQVANIFSSKLFLDSLEVNVGIPREKGYFDFDTQALGG